MIDVYVSKLTLEDINKAWDYINKYRTTVTNEEGKEWMDFDNAKFDTEEEAINYCESKNKENNGWSYRYLKPNCELAVFHGSLNVWSKAKHEKYLESLKCE